MKENDKIGYVYLTTNLVNGKQYVGQHLHDGFDVKYKGSGTAIAHAINKYGWDNFKCEVICWCSTQTQLNEAEDNYIKLLDTMYPKGYNLRGGGSHGKHSKESCKTMSESQKKYFESEENRKKHIETMQKYWGSEEGKNSRVKMSESQKKRYQNPIERKKQSELAKKRSGEKHPMYGKHHTEEARMKQKEARDKYWENEENRKKQSEARKGRVAWNKGLKGVVKDSEETRKKKSKAMINHPKFSKKVLQYTLNGEFVKEWCSLSEIHRQLGFLIQGVSDCCLGHRKTYKGSIWRYADSTQQETPLQILQ